MESSGFLTLPPEHYGSALAEEGGDGEFEAFEEAGAGQLAGYPRQRNRVPDAG